MNTNKKINKIIIKQHFFNNDYILKINIENLDFKTNFRYIKIFVIFVIIMQIF